jgi:hypothetical protein
VKLTIHLYLVLTLRMHELPPNFLIIHPHGEVVNKKAGSFTFHFYGSIS